MKISINLFPTIFTLIIAISLLVDSNFITTLTKLLNPIFNKINFPTEVLPLAILRPISGSSSLIILDSIIAKYGADSFIGILSSVMQGSLILLFILLVCILLVLVLRKIRYSLVVGLLADLLSIIISLLVVTIYFS